MEQMSSRCVWASCKNRVHHLLKLLFSIFPGSRVLPESQMPLERIIGGENIVGGSVIWNLPTNSSEILWLDQERRDSVSGRSAQMTRALSLQLVQTKNQS